MAKEKLDLDYTRFANKIIEALAKINGLSGRDYRVILTLARKTWGFHKKSDRISLSQFVKSTGINKENISRILSKLCAISCIFCDKTTNPITYGINKNVDEWGCQIRQGVVNSDNHKGCQFRQSRVVNSDKAGLSIPTTTKDILTKEIFTKERRPLAKKNVDNFSDEEKSGQPDRKLTHEEMSQIIAQSLKESEYQDNDNPVKDQSEDQLGEADRTDEADLKACPVSPTLPESKQTPLDRFNAFVATPENVQKIIQIVKTLWYWSDDPNQRRKPESLLRDSIDRMRAWIMANPKKGNKKDWMRFIHNWLRDDIARIKEDAYRLKAQMTSEEEADYYASKQRSRAGADDKHGFEPIGNLVNKD